MKMFEERILRDGKCLPGGVLKVDGFINHQMDPALMMSLARELARRFGGEPLDRVLTVEASGIAPAVLVGYLLGLPVVFAKKKSPSTMENALSARVRSFTKGCDYDVCLSRDFLHAGDRVLFIDDFLANGNAALGMLELVGQAGASLAGMGFLIEKAFQPGGAMLREKGIRVESLARIESSGRRPDRIRPLGTVVSGSVAFPNYPIKVAYSHPS